MEVTHSAWRSLRTLMFASAVVAAVHPHQLLAQPANDQCSQAIRVTAGEPIDGDNTGATSDLPASPCGIDDDKDIWFAFRATSAGRYRFQFVIDILATLHQPSLTIYSSCGGTMLACSDTPGPDRIDFDMSAGQDVRVRVAGSNGETGLFHLDIDHAPPPPANDECAGASPVALNEFTYGDTYEATASATASACISGVPDAWFEFVAPVAGVYHAMVPNRGMRMSVHRGGCQGQFEIFCDSSCNEYVRASVPLSANQTMRIRTGSCDGSPTNFAVRVDNYPAPANDECTAATPIAPGATVSGTTRGATGDVDPQPLCGERDLFDVWYTFTSPAASTLMYRFTAVPVGEFDPTLTIIDVCGGGPIACDDNGGPLVSSSVSVSLAPGQTVKLRVAGVDVSDGEFFLTASAGAPPPSNDECETAAVLTPGTSTMGSTGLASGFGNFLTPCAREDDIDVWYRLTNPAAASRIFSIDTIGTTDLEFPSLAAFDNCNGAMLACNTNHFQLAPDARIDVIVQAGQTIFIRVSGLIGAVGDFQLNVSEGVPVPAVPSNDQCASAIPLSLPASVQVAVGTAGPDLSIVCDSRPDADPSSGGVWYVLTPATDCRLLIRQSGTFASFALFEGPCEALTEAGCTADNPAVVDVLAGRTYRMLVARQQEDASPLDAFDFTIECYTPVTPSDTCAGALTINLPFAGFMDNSFAANEGLADAPAGSCNSPDAQLAGMNHSLYLRFVAPVNGNLRGTFSPFFFNQIVAVYSGSCGSLVEVACADEPQPIQLGFAMTAGTPYIIQVGSQGTDWIGDQIPFELNYITTTCRADFNGSGSVTVQDIFDFLGAYFSGQPAADFNASGSITVQDIFDFLNAYFTGC